MKQKQMIDISETPETDYSFHKLEKDWGWWIGVSGSIVHSTKSFYRKYWEARNGKKKC